MNKLVKKIKFWFIVSRAYSFPMSVMSFIIPFLFGMLDGGNVFNGLIAFAGVIFAHAGVNMFDDYADYSMAMKAAENGVNTQDIFQKGKCAFLLNGSLKKSSLLFAISVSFTLAVLCGLILIYKTGITVAYLMLIAGVLGILYPFLTFVALGEITVGIMFAPLLYIGVYYVMTQGFSKELIPLAFSTGLLTIGLLHAHMFMDYNFDKKNKKTTLCSLAGNKKNAVKTQVVIMFLAYFNIILQCFFLGLPKIYLISLISIPTAYILYMLMKKEADGNTEKITPNVFFGVLENLDQYNKIGNADFMIKFMVARNIMAEFSFLICLAKILTEII